MAPECSKQSSDQTLDYGPWPVQKFGGVGPSRRSILVVGVRIGFVSVRSHQIGDTTSSPVIATPRAQSPW
jgi:hypothetical protein